MERRVLNKNTYIHYFFLPHEKLQFFKNVFKLTSLKEKIEVKGLFYFRAK